MATVAKCKRSAANTSAFPRSRSNEERIVRRRIYELLGKPKTASRQFYAPDKGWIYTRARGTSSSQFYTHLRGEKTLAFSPLVSVSGCPCALFICFDIDERFKERLDIMRGVLDQHGALSGAWATTGSDPGRGKIIVSLASPMPQGESVSLASRLLQEARTRQLWDEETKKVDTFPKRGEGGVVRILGRNQSRADEGHVDAPLDMFGNPTDLGSIVPWAHGLALHAHLTAYPSPLSMRVDSGRENTTGNPDGGKPPLAIYVRELRTTPYRGDGTTIYKDMWRLACVAIRHVDNQAEGRAAFNLWCDEVLAQIPADKTQTRRQIAEGSARERAWQRATSWIKSGVGIGEHGPLAIGEWEPLASDDFVPFRDFRKPSPGAWRAYMSGSQRVAMLARNPHCFALAYSEWQRLGDYDDKSNCLKDVNAAEDAGLLVRLDRGEARVGSRLITLVAFVGRGETPQRAYMLGVMTTEFKQQQTERREKQLPRFLRCVKDNRLFIAQSAVELKEVQVVDVRPKFSGERDRESLWLCSSRPPRNKTERTSKSYARD